MELDSLDWKRENALTEHYRHDFGSVRRLFEYDPRGEESLTARAEWLDDHRADRADRDKLADVLVRYNRRIGNSEQALSAAESLRSPDALAVVGGQQAGLFTGPLYVVHKAITIIQTAAQAAKRLKRPVTPVFWVAGEDHDFDEVNHVYFLSAQQAIGKVKIEHPTGKRASVSQLVLSAACWEDAVGQMERALPDTEFKPGLIGKLRDIAARSRTLADFFGAMMAWLFADYGLVLVDSDDPGLRELEAPMFGRLLDSCERLNEAYRESTDLLESLGYRPQVELNPDSANVFFYFDGERQLLQIGDKGFTNRNRDFLFGKEELLEMARTGPRRFSNNVLTRPIMQEYLFPVLQTVLGPGEIAYWAQTGRAFRLLEMRMPPLVPRLELTLVEGTVRKHMRKFDLSFEDVVRRFEDQKKAWLERQDQMRLAERFEQVKREFQQLYGPVLELAAEIDPGLRKLGDVNMRKIIEQIEFLENRAKTGFESQFEAALRQLERIRLSILPLEKPQERVYNVCAYLNRYGDRWLHELIGTEIGDPLAHQIVYF